VVPVAFHPEATRELLKSARFYEEQSPGLGQEFLDTIERAVEVLQEYPEAGTPFWGPTRRYLVQRFPFGIIYHVHHSRILLYAIMHVQRRPGYWVDRL